MSGGGGHQARTRPAFAVVPLAAHHNRAVFACGNDDLDRYLRQFVGQDERRDVTRAFVLVGADDPPTVLAYYTLSAGQILTRDLPDEAQRRLPRREQVPAILLGRLAVDQRMRGQGFGRFVLLDAIERVLHLRIQLGVWAMVVDAIDEPAARFYEYHGFRRLTNQPTRLYVPLRDAERIASGAGE